MTGLELTLLIALGLALVLGAVAHRLGVPPMIGYVVAGLAVGPATPGFVAGQEEVLALVARGRTNAEIASELSISLSTVKTHLASLMNKLGARNRVELAMWAYETDRVPA